MFLQRITACGCALLLLTACGDSSSLSEEMHYIKTSVMYDTIYDMYQNPDNYLGGNYHMVGTLYPGSEDNGETFYSVYTNEPNSDHGLGIELDWDDYEGLQDYDRITVEGRLDRQKVLHNGEEMEVLILRVSMLEKRKQ